MDNSDVVNKSLNKSFKKSRRALLCVADGMVRVSIAMGKAALENPHMVGEHHIYVNECWKVKMVKFDIQFHEKNRHRDCYFDTSWVMQSTEVTRIMLLVLLATASLLDVQWAMQWTAELNAVATTFLIDSRCVFS